MPQPQDLTYSRLVVIRVSHTEPSVTSAAAEAIRLELKAALSEWCRITPAHPKVELITLGIEDFPLSVEEVHEC